MILGGVKTGSIEALDPTFVFYSQFLPCVAIVSYRNEEKADFWLDLYSFFLNERLFEIPPVGGQVLAHSLI